MTRYALIPLLALILAGCPAKKPEAPPAGTSTPPAATSQPKPEPAATPEPDHHDDEAADADQHEEGGTEADHHAGDASNATDHVDMNGTDPSYTAKTDDGYIVVVTPTPIPLAAGASTWAIAVTAPAEADINVVELEAEAVDAGTSKKIDGLKLTAGDPGKGTLEWSIPGPGSYEVEIHVDRGSAGDSHTKFTFTVA